MFIKRISDMIELRKLQKKYCDEKGNEPYNVSSWNASDKYSQGMLSILKTPDIETIDYVYTYSLSESILNDVKKKIDPNLDENMKISFTDNGTQAIMTLVNLIKQYNYKKICIINPSYFSVGQALNSYNINYEMLNFKRVGDRYVLPTEDLMKANYELVWITSPVFSTSSYYDNETVDAIEKLLDMGTIVISDECFCVHGNELIRRIKNKDNFIAIYSPHKSLCINTYKFAVIVFPIRYDMFIEHWVDVLTGNLSASSLGAISHFTKKNYEECLFFYKNYMAEALSSVYETLNSYEKIMYDNVQIGSLLTIYFKNLDYEQSKSLDFMEDVINNTKFSFYPSYLNGLDESFGFAFRINLALYDDNFIFALNKLVNYLSNK